MAIVTIAALTLTEAVRRRTLLGSLLLGLLTLGLSLLLWVIHARMQHLVAVGRQNAEWMAIQYPLAQSAIMSLCLSSIKTLGAIFGALLAGGAISSEIERGLLAVILPRPLPRWQILLGKWIGLNLILVGSSLFWTTLVWASLTLQTHRNLIALLHAGLYLALFPVVVATLALTLSTVAPRLFGTTFALTLGAFAWFDGIFATLGEHFDTDLLKRLADFAGLVVPQGYIGWWVEDATQEIIIQAPRGPQIGVSPQYLTALGSTRLHFAHLDGVYVAAYILAVLLLGMVLFQRRDIG